MKKSLVWIRRDIRLNDHTALSAACSESDEVNLVFVFDKNIIGKLPENDRRISFIHEALKDLHEELEKYNSGINILYGDPADEIPKFAKKKSASKVFFNRDYETYSIKRDDKVTKQLNKHDIDSASFRDHVLFESHEVLKKDNTPYKVFTPYKRAWIDRFQTEFSRSKTFKTNNKKFSTTVHHPFSKSNWMNEMGFTPQELTIPTGRKGALSVLKQFKEHISTYHETRNLLEKLLLRPISVYQTWTYQYQRGSKFRNH